MAPWQLTRTIEARMGVKTLALTLTYRLVDPVAIGLTLATPHGPATWCVAREVLRDGLSPDRAPVYAGVLAARVQLSTQPGTAGSLLTLRAEGGVRWPLTVATAELAAFLELAERACSLEREAGIVSGELDAQLAFMQVVERPAPRRRRPRKC